MKGLYSNITTKVFNHKIYIYINLVLVILSQYRIKKSDWDIY